MSFDVTSTPQWTTLAKRYEETKDQTLRKLFAADASRASKMSSAQRVRSALFFSVRVGTGKVFQPRVLE